MKAGVPPYYLVWAEGGFPPRHQHGSLESAESEARRLADLNPGKSFAVLAPTYRVTIGATKVERFDPDAEVPF